MTVVMQKHKTNRRFTGLSTDPKPTLALEDSGDEFYETDTADLWVWYGASWKIPETVTTIPPIELGAATGQATRVDFVGDTLIYRAEADPGTTDGQSLWRVRRLTIGAVDGDVTEEWADGNSDYDNIWTNRLSLSYS